MDHRYIKFRVRSNATAEIIGYEELIQTSPGSRDRQWAASYDGINWSPGVLTNRFVSREQHIGMCDADGKEIYEYDLIEFDNDIGNGKFRDRGLVEFDAELGSYQLVSPDIRNKVETLWAFQSSMKKQPRIVGDFYHL